MFSVVLWKLNCTMETWTTRYCKLGQGSQCCKHLVRAGNKKYACNKVIAQPDTFLPLPDAIGDNCEGIKDLASIEKSFQKIVTSYRLVGLTLNGKNIISTN